MISPVACYHAGMFNQEEGGGRHDWWAPTEQEKLSAFGAPVVVLANADPDTSRWVGLDRIDDKPVTLDVVYGRGNGNQVIHVRNVRTYDPPLRVEFSDLARTTLSELLLQCEYFRRDSDEDRRPQRARSEEFLEQLRNQTPEPAQLVLDGSVVEAQSFQGGGFLTVEAATPAGQVIVAGPADVVDQCELQTTGPE